FRGRSSYGEGGRWQRKTGLPSASRRARMEWRSLRDHGELGVGVFLVGAVGEPAGRRLAGSRWAPRLGVAGLGRPGDVSFQRDPLVEQTAGTASQRSAQHLSAAAANRGARRLPPSVSGRAADQAAAARRAAAEPAELTRDYD